MNISKNFNVVCDFLKQVKAVYENTTKKSFSSLFETANRYNEMNSLAKTVIDMAIFELVKDKLVGIDISDIENVCNKEKFVVKICGKYYFCNNANVCNTISKLAIDDIVCIWSCLKLSQKGSLLLLHYDDMGIFNNPYLTSRSLVWACYEGILSQCRSVVVNIDDFTIASLPFYKFQNMNETEEYSQAIIENMLSTAKNIEFSDKLDGSMMQLRWYREELLMTSSNSLNINKCFQLSDAYSYVKENNKYIELCQTYPDYTVICEWIAKNDMHIVRYAEKDFGLSLIGMRNVVSGELKTYAEIIDIATKFNIPCTTLYSETLGSVLSKLGCFSSAEKEGYVVNIDGFLVKIKCDDFVLMTRTLKELNSFKNVIPSVVNNTVDDLLSKVPEQHKSVITEKVQFIYGFKNKFDSLVEYYYNLIPVDADKKTVMKFIDSNMPKYIRGYVRTKYFGMDYDVLASFKHTNNPKYISKTEIDKWIEIIEKTLS